MPSSRPPLGQWRAVALVVCLTFAPPAIAPSAAQDPAEDDNPVVARVDGAEILLSDVVTYAANLPPQYRTAFDQIFPFLVQRLIDLALLDKAAESNDLASDPEVEMRIALLTVRVVRELYVERLLARKVDDAAVEARYQAFLLENPPAEEVRARHILVDSEEDAREIIVALDGGGDFAELAREHSTGPSSAQGGDLGYFVADQMVPAFSEAAFAMETGTYSEVPIQTEFGWHVILIEDRRAQAPPSFEETEQQLREELQGAAIEAHLGELRDNAEIDLIVSSLGPEGEAEQPGAMEGDGGGAEEPPQP